MWHSWRDAVGQSDRHQAGGKFRIHFRLAHLFDHVDQSFARPIQTSRSHRLAGAAHRRLPDQNPNLVGLVLCPGQSGHTQRLVSLPPIQVATNLAGVVLGRG